MNGWVWQYLGYEPERERTREALCTLGNGYFATRGAAPECSADPYHYPGTYLAGGYDRTSAHVDGQIVENEDLVNLPNWLHFTCRRAGGPWFHPDQTTIQTYEQTLDLAQGMLSRTVEYADAHNRRTRIEERRLVHMDTPHLAAQQISVTPLNWSGVLEIRSGIDGRVENRGVQRYLSLPGKHLACTQSAEEGSVLLLSCRFTQSGVGIALAVRQRLRGSTAGSGIPPDAMARNGSTVRAWRIPASEGRPIIVEKIVALHSSRDTAISEPGEAALNRVRNAPDFAALAKQHSRRWRQLWRRFDLRLTQTDDESADRIARILRLHIFHLLQTASPHTTDLDVGVPARGLHGEAYRGHIFWDELFIFPLLNFRMPEVTRALLRYRFRRLDLARENARAAGLGGALYPWQSGSSGREESQRLHLNPASGRWIPDHTHLQWHVNGAVAYNIWQYYQITEDLEFLSFYGAEMMLEIARFWGTAVRFDDERKRYVLHGVVGPDEFHDGYPGNDQAGLKNNSYTNLMAAWTLWRAGELRSILPDDRWQELAESLQLAEKELDHWENVSRSLYLPFIEDGIISQFEGYEDLVELDWQRYHEKYGDIHRLDRILEAEGDSANRYKAAKQPDVLMLFYLFSADELANLLGRLGYPYTPDLIPANIAYYSARTTHGSSLSRVVHAWVTARSDRARSWDWFCQALEGDVSDLPGGTTAEGIHLGAMAGAVDLMQRAYTGMEAREDVLWFSPALPDPLNELRLRAYYRGSPLDVRISRASFSVRRHAGHGPAVRIGWKNQIVDLPPGTSKRFVFPA